MKGFDLFFIPMPFGNSTSWQEIRSFKFRILQPHISLDKNAVLCYLKMKGEKMILSKKRVSGFFYYYYYKAVHPCA
jgi:hypothetical protein